MKLEQIYESYYVNPLVAINSASATELLEAFEQAAIECAHIKNILANLKENQLPVNESHLTDAQKIFFVGAVKLVNSYKESTDAQFKARFETLLEDTPTAAPATGGKPGWWGKIKDFLINVSGTLKGVLQGFVGSEGKDRTGRDKPSWATVNTTQDLSKVPLKEIAITANLLRSYGVKEDTLVKIEKGTLAGVNIIDVSDNLITVKVEGGRFVAKREPTFQPAMTAARGKRKTSK